MNFKKLNKRLNKIMKKQNKKLARYKEHKSSIADELAMELEILAYEKNLREGL